MQLLIFKISFKLVHVQIIVNKVLPKRAQNDFGEQETKAAKDAQII